MRHVRALALIVLVLGLVLEASVSPALAVDYTWIGLAWNEDWFGMRFDGATWWTNWFPFGFPQTSSDNALISTAGAQVVLSENVTINDLTIGDPAASLLIGGCGLTANGATNWGTLEFTPSWMPYYGPGTLYLGTGTLTNNGTVSATDYTYISAYLVNNGVTDAGLLSYHGDVTNPGAVNVLGWMYIGDATTVVNTGLIRVNPAADAHATGLLFRSSATLSGSGSVVLSGVGDPTLAQLNTDPGILLTNAPDHTLSGCGEVNASLANAGLVDANVSGQLLVLKTNAKSNSGTMKATGGGWLAIQGITITQSGAGQILADGGEVLLADGATIVGGTLNGHSAITNLGGTNTLTDVTNLGPFDILGGTTLAVNGSSLVNHGTITVNPSGVATDTVLKFGPDAALGGTGSVFLSAVGSSARLNGPRGELMLVQNSQHTIHGFGQVYANMVNYGRVQADVHGEVLEVNAWTTFRNYGTLQAINSGILRFVGGTVANAGTILIPEGSTFTADTYMQTAGSTTVDGTFEVTGHVADILGGIADFNTDLGSKAAADLTLNVRDAVVNFGSNQHLAGLALAGGAKSNLVVGHNKVLVTKALGIEDVDGVPTSRLDLTDNAMIIDYDGLESTPLQSIRRWIASGYNGKQWNGNGIVSTAAAGNPFTVGLGYAQNDLLFPKDQFSTFAGQAVDLTTILVKYTYLGDVNLDGKVDDNDVTILVLNYDRGLADTHTWAEGDVSRYDGKIDDNDVTALVLNYGSGWKAGMGGPLGGISAAVPEPATLSLLALGGLGMLLRRRRK